MNAPAQLVPRFGVASDQAYTLNQRITTVGREEINDVSLPDAEISRRHARIVFDNGVYRLEDLGSTNGTFVNGQRIQAPVSLQDGMTIDFGEKHRFTFTFAGVSASDLTMIDPGADAFNATMVDPLAMPADATLADPIADSQVGVPTRQEAIPPATTPFPADPIPAEPLKTEVLAPTFEDEPSARTGRKRGRTLLGAGCLILVLVFICSASVFFLDSYDGGSLLYCGPLQGVWEGLAGVLGQSWGCSP